MHSEVLRLQKTDDRRLKTEDQRYVIDHINGDGRDNRVANLRLANYSQNSQNRRKRLPHCARNDNKNYSSKYKGVWLDKKTRKWRAQICFGGKKKHLGYYNDEAEAARVYDAAAVKFHGRFARLNFNARGINGWFLSIFMTLYMNTALITHYLSTFCST
jgi:hypothetical protein